MDTNNDTPVVDIVTEALAKNVIEKCKIESERNSLQIPLNDYKRRGAYYTGLPESFVSNLIKDRENHAFQNQPFDVFQRMLILKALLKSYISKEFPTPGDIYETVKESINVKDMTLFQYMLTQMGFDYRKTTTGQILTEDMKLTFDRFNYLNKIKKFKKQKIFIYYLDERVIDETLKFPKPDLDKISDTENASHLYNGYYFYHVFSDKGLENYLFTNKKSKDVFRKWVFDVLLKLLKPGSIIVIDDHPLHGKLVDDSISRYHSKSDMLKWLKKNQIPCAYNMQRAELFELISKSNINCNEYDFDMLVKAHGFDVLRLPYGCRNMSPSSLLWKEFATKQLSDVTLFSPIGLEEKITPEIQTLHSQNWKKLTDRITYWEDQFIDMDARIEDALENICTFHVDN